MKINKDSFKRPKSSTLISKKEINKKFKDNRERFRLFNSFHKQPSLPHFMVLSSVSVVFSIIPLCFPDMYQSLNGWLFWGLGLFVSFGFEQAANYHYSRFSRVANKKTYDQTVLNVRINKTLRMISMFGWVLSVVALSLMIITKDGSLSSIW